MQLTVPHTVVFEAGLNRGQRLVITALVAAVAVWLVSRFLESRRDTVRRHVSSGAMVLRYPRRFKLVHSAMLGACVMMDLVIAFVVRAASPADRMGGILLVGVLVIGFAWSTVEAYGRRVTLDEGGIESRSGWGSKSSLAWEDIEGVSYSLLRKELVLRGGGGRVVRISRYLSDVAELQSAIRSHLPADALTKAKDALSLFALPR